MRSGEAVAARRRIASPQVLDRLVGEEVAVSGWWPIDQERIDLFAVATGDDQWLHVNPVRAASGPYGKTIAHGFLTLSLLPLMLDEAIELADLRMGVNYGLNKVRFPAPVTVDARIRLRARLLASDPLPDLDGVAGRQITWQLSAEREGVDKPVCVAETLSRRHWGPVSRGTR